MSDLEERIQKGIVKFCKLLPQHVEKWSKLLEESVKPLQALSNYAEQLRHIEKAEISYLKDFTSVQEQLQFQSLKGVEEELSSLKKIIHQLEAANSDLKNKLSTLEQLTTQLDWEQDTLLIRGTGRQPSLTRLLQNSLEFSTLFSKTFKNINASFKTLDIRDEKSVKQLHNAFSEIDLKDNDCINYLIAITQYVNEKPIV